MTSAKISFIGAGNMASSIIGGLVAQGYAATNITASDPYPESLEKLKAIAPSINLFNVHMLYNRFHKN